MEINWTLLTLGRSPYISLRPDSRVFSSLTSTQPVHTHRVALMLVPAEGQGGDCPATRSCGNLTISRPLWAADWQPGRSCGPLDFQVNCSNPSTPVLRSSGIYGFAILNITYEERSLHVVDLGKLEFLNGSNSCHARVWNTSDKLPPLFKVDPANLALVLYNCTEAGAAAARRDGALVGTRARCGDESEVFFRAAGRYDDASDYSGYAVEGCGAVVVPVLDGGNGEVDANDYEKIISGGFLLTWENPLALPPVHVKRRVDNSVVRPGRVTVTVNGVGTWGPTDS